MTTAVAPAAQRTGFRVLTGRFFGYLSADGLNYALGFVIYGWLVRILTTRQYGELSIATTVYQTLMMVAALGLDLTGAKLIREFGGGSLDFVRKAQRLRLLVAVVVCGPLQIGAAIFAWKHGSGALAVVILASFSMVLARALDLTYVAVALRLPAPLAKTRALGLSIYLLLLIVCTPVARHYLWLVPVLNAVGVTIGRLRLGKLLRPYAIPARGASNLTMWDIAIQGAKASGGQLLLLILQTGDVVLLAKYVSADVVGQYAQISRLYLLGLATLGAMFNTFLPEIVHAAADSERLRSLFRMCVVANLALGIAGAAAFWILGAPLSQFLAHRPLATVQSLSPVFAFIFLEMSLAYPFVSILPTLHRGTEYMLCAGSAALVLLAADLLLMPRYGGIGAAYGQALVTAYLAVCSIAVYTRHVRKLAPVAAMQSELAGH